MVGRVLLMLAVTAAPAWQDLRTPPPAAPEGGYVRLAPLLVESSGDRGRDRRAWDAQRRRIEREWRDRLGPFPPRVSLRTEVVSTEPQPDHTRLLLRYRVEEGVWADAYLLIPADLKSGERRPAAVVFHPTTATSFRDAVGLDGRESVHQALHLVRRGFVCIAPRNYLWADPGVNYQTATRRLLERPPWKTGMARMLWDGLRATDVLVDRPEVDSRRLVSLGHSLGGKEALYHAAFDPRIRAAISCEGGIGVRFSNWDAEWYLGRQVHAPDFRTDHHELLALVAPRAFLLIGGESADGAQSWPFIEAALPVWRLHDREAALGLLRHAHGHNFPPPGPERDLVWRWLDDQLDVRPDGRR